MAEKTQLVSPDYKKIYLDLINHKFPERMEELKSFFNQKKDFNFIDVIKLNNMLFGNNEKSYNKKLRVYTKSDINKILETQKLLGLNNSQTAQHFKLSRNTLAKWQKMSKALK